MADRDRTAVDVEFLGIDAEFVAAINHLDGIGLIQLPQVDVVDLQPMPIKQARDRRDRAEAPSESWLALPALIVLPSNTGLMLASPSAVVSGRGPSSLVSVISLSDTCLVSLSMTAILVLNGTISSLKRPP